jgi:Asp/Glu/hydantoin racemase
MSKKKNLVLIHNSLVLMENLKQICTCQLPNVKVINLVDESLLRDIMEIGKVTYLMAKRISRYVISAEEFGADAVLMTCSSLSETVDTVKNLVNIPVLKMDEPMAEKAVNVAKKIGVIGTLQSVVGPSTRLIKSKALTAGKKVVVESIVCEEAFKALIAGDREKHNHLLLLEVEKIKDKVDLIVLAQGSMAPFAPVLNKETGKQVLTCLESGIIAVGKTLGVI